MIKVAFLVKPSEDSYMQISALLHKLHKLHKLHNLAEMVIVVK